MAHEQSFERWKANWQHAFFAVALTLATLGAVAGTDGGARPVGMRLALVTALVAWYAYWFVLRRETGPGRLPYLLGVAVLGVAMTALDPALLWAGAAALVPYYMHHVRWGAAGVAVCAGGWLWQRLAGAGALDGATVLSSVLMVLAVGGMAGYIATLDHEGRKRQRLLDELAATHAELAVAERQAGVLAERQRLARDIHDTLTQGFTSISLLLDAALADLPADGPASRRVRQAMRTARENLDESRRLIDAMRPAQLDGSQLPDAVRQLTSRLRDETGVVAGTVVTGEPVALDPVVETELLRVVQEALTNVRRHAAAHRVTVTLSYLDGVAVIDVQDDGAGFAGGAGPTGVGLAAMRERVDALGGTLAIESAPGEGTTVAVTVPATAAPPPLPSPVEEPTATGRAPAP